jgi:hypothetical protein
LHHFRKKANPGQAALQALSLENTRTYRGRAGPSRQFPNKSKEIDQKTKKIIDAFLPNSIVVNATFKARKPSVHARIEFTFTNIVGMGAIAKNAVWGLDLTGKATLEMSACTHKPALCLTTVE